jgi:hypothetical protein
LIKNIIIYILIFVVGVLYSQRNIYMDKYIYLTSREHLEYNKKIREWIPPLEIPTVKEPEGGWENRYYK